jgi:hypothetical protein
MNQTTNLIRGILLLSLLAIPSVWAEEPSVPASPESQPITYLQVNPAYQYFMAPGTDNQLLMKINIWGEVERPGVLEVPDRTDLLSALSLAGGPKEGAKLTKVKVIRGFNGEKRSWEVNLKQAVNKGEMDRIPMLQPGDTVIVPKGGFRIFSKFLTVAYNVAVIVTASALLLN